MAIHVQIIAKDVTMTDRIEEYVQKKFGKLDHYLDYLEEVRVEIKYNATARQLEDRHVTQVTARGKGKILRVEERKEDVFASIDTALDKIERRIEKLKGKQAQKNKNESMMELTREQSSSEGGIASDLRGPAIIRRKKMMLEPMSEKDAMEQMQMLGHEEFFVFQNTANGKICVIYRRRDGDFGMIENEVR